MPSTAVNPTRMELTRLKNQLQTARRGHKLLKDKRDELMKQFLDIVRENRILRNRVETALLKAHGAFDFASAMMSPEMLEQSLLYPKQSVALSLSFRNIMSVDVPSYQFDTQGAADDKAYPYGFAFTSCALDEAVDALAGTCNDLLHLAEVEKTAQLLSQEIEKTRRRVNALEYVKIPQMEESIKYISMKLDENERSTTIRLMKVKDMLLKQSIEEQKERDAKGIQSFEATSSSKNHA